MEDVPPQESFNNIIDHTCLLVTEVRKCYLHILGFCKTHTLICYAHECIGFPWPHETLLCVLIIALIYIMDIHNKI